MKMNELSLNHVEKRSDHPARSIGLRRMGRILIFSAVCCLMFAVGDRAQACPSCVDTVAAITQGGPTDGGVPPVNYVAEGYNYSIYFMIGMIYGVIGLSGLFLWYAVRKYAPSREILMGENTADVELESLGDALAA